MIKMFLLSDTLFHVKMIQNVPNFLLIHFLLMQWHYLLSHDDLLSCHLPYLLSSRKVCQGISLFVLAQVIDATAHGEHVSV